MRAALLFTVVLTTLAAWVSACGNPTRGRRQYEIPGEQDPPPHGSRSSLHHHSGSRSVRPGRGSGPIEPQFLNLHGSRSLLPEQSLCREHKWFGIWVCT
ncbi:hypothetical protein GE061_018775 [Apolygus lucorum]|uniref:Uncharacterized protein n=1 Tax=Apolygus lucorum TaxID=248454 RepID=A0A6A4JFP1_APOLU|nr:hypothetical protein GE061_018775 [Apolygus lucorum]